MGFIHIIQAYFILFICFCIFSLNNFWNTDTSSKSDASQRKTEYLQTMPNVYNEEYVPINNNIKRSLTVFDLRNFYDLRKTYFKNLPCQDNLSNKFACHLAVYGPYLEVRYSSRGDFRLITEKTRKPKGQNISKESSKNEDNKFKIKQRISRIIRFEARSEKDENVFIIDVILYSTFPDYYLNFNDEAIKIMVNSLKGHSCTPFALMDQLKALMESFAKQKVPQIPREEHKIHFLTVLKKCRDLRVNVGVSIFNDESHSKKGVNLKEKFIIQLCS